MLKRNPDPMNRPSFKMISENYLKQPSGRLLYCSTEDDKLSPKVGVCGAELEEAQHLHKDLQRMYAKFIS